MQNLIDETVSAVFNSLKNKKFPIRDEIKTQILMESIFNENPFLKEQNLIRSHRLSDKDIVDFYFEKSRLAIEVKVKGQGQEILNQCRRYCEHDTVDAIILVTAFYIGFPKDINTKPCWLYHLSRNFL